MKSKIELITDIPGLNDIEDAVPKPASKFLPDWWRDTPALKTETTLTSHVNGNFKICPSFPDYFSRGFIVPMWVDSILYADKDENNEDIWAWKTSNEQFSWQAHANYQYLKDVPHKYFGKESYFVFKAKLPWYVFTSPGISVYQLPTFFHFHEDFSVVPGVRDADIYHELNIQLLIHSKKKEIFIPRGTPLAHYIPFDRNLAIDLEIKYAEGNDINRIEAHRMNVRTKFSPLVAYKQDKKKRSS